MEPWKQELYHHGILGMRWGKRNGPPYPLSPGDHSASEKKAGWRKSLDTSYSPKGLRAKIAKRQNDKVDKSFKKWNEGAKNRQDAIDLGKKANQLRMESNNDPSKKKDFRKAQKEYKKALRNNTTYRKGQVRKEVGSDLSRKLLSESKKIKKELDKDPNNKKLRKKYDDLMAGHEIERAKARRAQDVAANRSAKKAAIKRGATITVKALATTAAVSAGLHAVNSYLSSHDVKRNGVDFRMSIDEVNKMYYVLDMGKNFMKFMY